MKQLRIGFVSRRDARQHPGGDSVQMDRLAEALRRRGHTVDILLGSSVSFEHDVDLIHVFNLQRAGETAVQTARSSRIAPTVLSPIYGDTRALDRGGRSLSRRLLAALVPAGVVEVGKHARRASRGVSEWRTVVPTLTRGADGLRRRVLNRCHGLYPNSRWEADVLYRIAGDSIERQVRVIPNGVDPGLLQSPHTGEQFRERFGIEDERFVVSVARFDERKNNLGLVRAALEAEVPCVLIGRPAPLHRAYFDQCAREAARGNNVRILEVGLSQNELAGAYRAAHVHALPSWLETPGLVSLEAALFGANIVVGECPPVREYFAEQAWYCQPADTKTISASLRAAFDAPRNALGMATRVLERYSWEEVARQQEAAYVEALN